MVSALDIEPFSGFAYFGVPTLKTETALRELALYDHLFLLRQWRFPLTITILIEFFGDDYLDLFENKIGWTPADAATLCKAMGHYATHDPNIITRGALRQAGVEKVLLGRMIPYFVHEAGTANAEYLSPYAAQKADMMFKPFIALRDICLLLPQRP